VIRSHASDVGSGTIGGVTKPANVSNSLPTLKRVREESSVFVRITNPPFVAVSSWPVFDIARLCIPEIPIREVFKSSPAALNL
jgi:hypothetical protein